MTYHWEEELLDADILADIEAAIAPLLPKGIVISGIALENTDEVSACYMSYLYPRDDIYEMDILKDIKGDVSSLYNACFEMRKK